MTERGALQVVGLGLAVSGEPGPALAGSTDWSLLLAVSTADGSPVTGLDAGAFSVTAVTRRRGKTSSARLDHAMLDEPLAGVYCLHFGGPMMNRLAAEHAPCVVDVRDARSHDISRGRALVQLGA